MTEEYRQLYDRWQQAVTAYERHDSLRNGQHEQDAWDDLIDYVEAHGLNYTEFDPRGTR